MMYIETINKLYLKSDELILLDKCHELLEDIITTSNDSDLEAISWDDLCNISEGLLTIKDNAERE